MTFLKNNILFSSQKFTSFSNETIAIIGPHIDTKNFEVGSEVCEEATSTLRKNKINFEENVLFLEHSSPQKKYLNLSYFAELQLCALNINKSNIFQTKVDTYRDRSWHSYRRDGSNAGRNIHLVLKC